MSGSLVSAPPAILRQISDERPWRCTGMISPARSAISARRATHLLRQRGLTVIELPFQAIAEIPPEGLDAGPRDGAMYRQIERNAAALDLPLKWPPRLPNTRLALGAAEWTRKHQPDAFAAVQERLFRAHFADGLDISDLDTVLRCASEFVTDIERLRAVLTSGAARSLIRDGQQLGEDFGVRGIPSWRIAGQLISGYVADEEFEQVTARATPPLPIAIAS